MEEIWIDIKNYEGLYKISNYGRVKSLDRTINQLGYSRIFKGRIMSPNKNNSGYYSIMIRKDGVSKRFLIHRLVMINFIGIDENKLDVNHKDGNKLNNRLDNLEWVTKSENSKHMVKNGLSNYDKQKKKISLIKDGIIYEFNSYKEANETLNLSNLSRLVKGEFKQIKGYRLIWNSN